MKKIVVFLFSLLFLFSCGQSQSAIDEAKQKMLDPQIESEVLSEDDIGDSGDTSQTQDLETSQNIRIVPLDANSPLEFDRISDDTLGVGEVIISGKILNDGGVDTIEVFFSNATSEFPNDAYTLQTFNPGDEVFKYVASSKNQVLDIGRNEYIFRAYSGVAENETKVIINVPDDRAQTSDENIAGEPESVQGEQNDETILLNLPTGTAYGEPVALSDTSVSYSQIQGLEISQESVSDISCSNITEYLTERIAKWFYWNTCRDTVAGKGISYNVIRLSGEEYFYERHYVDYGNNLYGVYELQEGEGVTPENIAEANTELKSKTFPNVDVVDDLMRDIINS